MNRAIPKSSSETDINNAIALAKKLRLYSLGTADHPPEQRFVDIAGKLFDGMRSLSSFRSRISVTGSGFMRSTMRAPTSSPRSASNTRRNPASICFRTFINTNESSAENWQAISLRSD